MSCEYSTWMQPLHRQISPGISERFQSLSLNTSSVLGQPPDGGVRCTFHQRGPSQPPQSLEHVSEAVWNFCLVGFIFLVFFLGLVVEFYKDLVGEDGKRAVPERKILYSIPFSDFPFLNGLVICLQRRIG